MESLSELAKDVARRTGVYTIIRPVLQARRYRNWIRRGKTGPAPDRLKEGVIREYGRMYGIRTLVETGTYRGDTLAAVRRAFDQLYSIELSPELHARAARRFRGDRKIHLLLGDSARVLPQVLGRLSGRALFWLDAHYSSGVTARAFEDTPVRAELDAVLTHPIAGHIILIDDARHFAPEHGYPSIAEVESHVRARAPDRKLFVEHDVIRIVV